MSLTKKQADKILKSNQHLKKMLKPVRVRIAGGVFHLVSKSKHVRVIVRDYDCVGGCKETPETGITVDKDGNHYHEWEE